MPQKFSLDKNNALESFDSSLNYYNLNKIADKKTLNRLPYSIRILLEASLRKQDGFRIQLEDTEKLLHWETKSISRSETAFMPGRVVLQDFTGVPAVVDLAALRSAMARKNGDPNKINPQVNVDLVIDHSVQVDYFGNKDAMRKNMEQEFERNTERYEFLKWGEQAFSNFRIIPPGAGIVHQVNLEYLASVCLERENFIYPDSLVGTDSHTTMINALGVLGWGVGGIEAEAVMLGQPIYMLSPDVVGVRLHGKRNEKSSATDLVLAVTEMLRKHGVVGKFVEFFGSGLSKLKLTDRATLSNMAPEYGATCGYFPVDKEAIEYLRQTGRDEKLIEKVEKYFRAQGLFREDDSHNPEYSDYLELDISHIEPAIAGPRRPQDRIALSSSKKIWQEVLKAPTKEGGFGIKEKSKNGSLDHGNVVIAAITSCTNTSNPELMIGAGLLAKKARAHGLKVKSYVKTSLAPGSRVVSDYLKKAELDKDLESLGFYTVGYGCTTCIGNSGPLVEEIAKEIEEKALVVASVLSGNRNFEGRISPHVKANFLASPPLVVAYALAGTLDIDFEKRSFRPRQSR